MKQTSRRASSPRLPRRRAACVSVRSPTTWRAARRGSRAHPIVPVSCCRAPSRSRRHRPSNGPRPTRSRSSRCSARRARTARASRASPPRQPSRGPALATCRCHRTPIDCRRHGSVSSRVSATRPGRPLGRRGKRCRWRRPSPTHAVPTVRATGRPPAGPASHRPSSKSQSSPRRASPIRRSPRACSCRAARSSPICPRSISSSASPIAPSSRRRCPRALASEQARRRRVRRSSAGPRRRARRAGASAPVSARRVPAACR